jgi:23S rRNA (guanine2535-N1)-methyltransferase
MEYKYVREKENYEDFSSGKVLFNASGTTAFPVRLASEIYLRGKSYLQSKGNKDKYTLYDPCCGGAYLLTTIGILHGDDLDQVMGSDIDQKAIELAKKNLGLLNIEGLDERIQQLRTMFTEYGKESHRHAIESALRLRNRIVQRNSSIMAACFQADATKSHEGYGKGKEVDFVITDVPYGDVVKWTADSTNPTERLLENIANLLTSHSVVAVVADKKEVIENGNYKRLQRFKVGKRQVVFLEPKDG